MSFLLLSSCEYDTSKKILSCVDSVSGYCARVPVDDYGIIGDRV